MTEQAERLPIAARYTRSVHMARDFDHIERALEGYQATPLVLQTLKHILERMRLPALCMITFPKGETYASTFLSRH